MQKKRKQEKNPNDVCGDSAAKEGEHNSSVRKCEACSDTHPASNPA